MLCPKVKEALLEAIKHVEEDKCPGCAPLKPLVFMAKLSPLYKELVKVSNAPPPSD